jgi:hypothetical protein
MRPQRTSLPASVALHRRRAASVGLALCLLASAGCATLLSADATPVPGAAATLTRSLRTPIPTTVESASPASAPSPSPPRIAIAASPSAAPEGGDASDAEIAEIRARMEQVTSSEALSGLESLLLDHVSVSTTQGGSVMEAAQIASWLRERAGPGIKVTTVDRGGQTLLVQVRTDSWPHKDPIQQGTVTFSLRRYDDNGRPDDESGTWKIDVIDAE